MTEIYKFVNHEVPSKDSLKDARAFRLREQLNHGKPLNRQDKNWITEQVNNNCFFRNAIALMGYCIPFKDVLRRFCVKQHGSWQEIWATDKTAIRYITYGRIDEIVELAK